MLSDFRDQILETLEDNFFGDPEIIQSIEWAIYRGRSTPEQTFTILDAALVKWEVGTEELEEGVGVQMAKRNYVIKESSLPAGVTCKDLTKNDHVTVEGTEYIAVNLNKTLEFVVYVELVGAQ